jgi:CRISPR-associated protein Cas2
MIWVCCYDVTDDRRRRRVHRVSWDHLTPVQRSVFEGELRGRTLGQLQERLLRAMDPTVDSVRLYSLCERCASRTRLLGTAFPILPPDDPIVY